MCPPEGVPGVPSPSKVPKYGIPWRSQKCDTLRAHWPHLNSIYTPWKLQGDQAAWTKPPVDIDV